MLATLRLFKALPIADKNLVGSNLNRVHLYKQTVPMGFVFSGEVVGNYPNLNQLMSMVDGLYGRDPAKLNKSFHKSFSKVRDSHIVTLLVEQIVHYASTYGAEAEGVFSNDRVFVPAERLDVPEITEGLNLVVIKGLTHAELKEKLVKLLNSGVALSDQSVSDVMEVAALVGFSAADIDGVKNREVKTALYDHFGLVPEDPSELLRYAIHKTTGSTLLIKNRDLVQLIREGVKLHNISPLFLRYENKVGLHRLGEVFYRYKPLFLAFRSDKKMRPLINKIRRAAKTHHKPMKSDYLNDVTAHLKRGTLEFPKLEKALATANSFRKIRLAQALRVRMNPDLDSILYRVRNGKSYATEFSFPASAEVEKAYNVVMDSLVDDLVPALYDKKVYIPPNMVYGLPATEKQFTGNLPSGTYVNVPGDMVAGVYWEDQDGHRIDLDLSMLNAQGKVGWDGMYRQGGNEVFFSGDNTSAPQGASEVFHIGQFAKGVWMLNLNYYNFNPGLPVPFKIVVGSQGREAINQNYVIDPNHLLAASESVIDVPQKMIGIIITDAKMRRFYFSESGMGGGISARNTEPAEQARKYLYTALTNAVSFNEVLERAGVTFVETPEEADLDLSPEAVDKTTLLELLSQ